MDFIINCDSASTNVFGALQNVSNNKTLTIKYIIEQDGYYQTAIKPDYNSNYKLNDFELYLTKFSNEWGVCADWHLRLNTKQYVIMDKKKLADTLNKLKQTPNQPEPPQTKIEPIKWLKNSNLLAYLINELKTYGFIDEDSIWAICEQIFVDKKGNPIKAETFTSMVKNYEYNQTPDGTKGKPKTHTEITDLIKTLKALSKEIE